MKRDQTAEREFARINQLDWDAETAWFDGVLFFVNGGRYSIQKGKKQTRGSFAFAFELPGLPGEWACGISNLLNWLPMPESIEPIRLLMFEIAEQGGASSKTWKKLRAIVGTVELKGNASLGPNTGEIRYNGEATVSCPTRWMALLLAELIQRGFDDRLRVCELPTCDNFFVAWDSRGSKPRLYCTSNHASQDRTAAARLGRSIEHFRRERRRQRK